MKLATDTNTASAITCACRTEPLMSVAEVSTAIKSSKSYLYEGLRDGRFPGLRLGDGYRIKRAFVEKFLEMPSGTSFEDFAAEWMAREATAVAS